MLILFMMTKQKHITFFEKQKITLIFELFKSSETLFSTSFYEIFVCGPIEFDKLYKNKSIKQRF